MTIRSAWALWPLILLPIPVNLLTNLITLDEKYIYHAGWIIIWTLLALQFLFVIKDTHNFELGQSISVMLLTLVGMVVVWILLGLVYALSAEIVRFIAQLVLEIYVRLY